MRGSRVGWGFKRPRPPPPHPVLVTQTPFALQFNPSNAFQKQLRVTLSTQKTWVLTYVWAVLIKPPPRDLAVFGTTPINQDTGFKAALWLEFCTKLVSVEHLELLIELVIGKILVFTIPRIQITRMPSKCICRVLQEDYPDMTGTWGIC